MRFRIVMAALAACLLQMAGAPAEMSGTGKRGEQNLYPAMEKEFSFRDFNSLRTTVATHVGRGRFISGKFNITVVKSDRYQVKMSVKDRDDIDMFDIRQRGNVLELVTVLKEDKGRSRSGHAADVTIYMPELEMIALSGSNNAVLSGNFTGQSLSVDLSGAAKLTGLYGKWSDASVRASGAAKIEAGRLEASKFMIGTSGASVASFSSLEAGTVRAELSGASVVKSGDVKTDDMQLQVSGGSNLESDGQMASVQADLSGAASVTLSGTGRSMSVNAAGGSSLKAKNLTMQTVSAVLTGASQAVVTVTESLDTNVSVGSSIDYYGNPKNVRSVSANVRKH